MSSVAAVEITDIDEVVFEDDVDIQEAKKPEGFVIDNQEKSTWAAHRLLRAEDRMKERGHLAKDYKAKIDTIKEGRKGQGSATAEPRNKLIAIRTELKGLFVSFSLPSLLACDDGRSF